MIQQDVHLADPLDKIGLRVFGDAGMARCCDKAEDTEPNLEAEVSLCCIGLWIYTSAFSLYLALAKINTSITNWHSQQMRIPEYHLHGLAGTEQLRAAAALCHQSVLEVHGRNWDPLFFLGCPSLCAAGLFTK